MSMRKAFVPILLAYAMISMACVYIVLPEGYETSRENSNGSTGWSAVATNIEKSESGDLHIDITIRNETGDWSAMNSMDDKPALLTNSGKSISCDTVFVSTGGHRLAPGFQMRGYTAGTTAEPVTQLIYVECAGAEATAGSILTIPYSYVTGQYNYYEQDKNKIEANLEINLDEVKTDLVYPIAEQIDGLIQQPDIEIVAINKVILTLTECSVPRVIYNSPGRHLIPVNTQHMCISAIHRLLVMMGYYMDTTKHLILYLSRSHQQVVQQNGQPKYRFPQNVDGFYIMLSVETGKARLFANYAIDITGE